MGKKSVGDRRCPGELGRAVAEELAGQGILICCFTCLHSIDELKCILSVSGRRKYDIACTSFQGDMGRL